MSDLLKNACCLSFLLHMEELFRIRNQCNFAHDLCFVHQSGSVGDRRVASLSLTAIVSLSKRLCPLLSTGSTHKDLTLHDFKIVGWDKKNFIIYYAMKYRKILIEYNA